MMLLAAVLFSSSGLFIKLLDGIPSLAILGMRSTVSFVLFMVWVRPRSFSFSRAAWAAAVCVMGMQLFFIMGNKVAPAANIIFLAYTAPIFIIPMARWLLNERPQPADWIAFGVIIVGMSFFVRDGFAFTGLLGLFFGVLTSFFHGSFNVMIRLLKDSNPAQAILLGHGICMVIGLPFAIGQTVTVTQMLMLGYLGLFQVGVGFILVTLAIKHIEALEANLLLTLEPILNPVWVFLVLDEVPTRLAFIGAGLVLMGVLYRAVKAAREKDEG